MNYKNWIWNQTSKFDCQLDALYYYSRITRILEGEIFITNAITDRKGIAIDIGANLGIWSYHLSKLFVQVEAFEPIAGYCDVIRSTRRKNISVHNEGLSSTAGNIELRIPMKDGRLLLQSARLCDVKGEFKNEVVPIKTLDDYAFANVKFMKIDVGGHEIEVLKGAKETIIREKPVMIIEIEQRRLDFPMDNVFELLKSYGYEAFFLSGRKLRRYTDFSYEMDQLPYLNNLSSIFYVHNFIFWPKDKRR
jgi:FkbM family methyltransferase